MNLYEEQLNILELAKNGDITAINNLMLSLKDTVYNMSVKFLFSKEDAEDATQEILLKVFSNLSKFKNNSKFSTWVYSIARNHLISMKKKKAQMQEVSFEIMEKTLNEHFDDSIEPVEYAIDRQVLIADLKVGCTQAMLLCLDEEKRIIFILSKIFNIDSNQGAEIFNITPQSYRKRLSRINEKMKNFLKQNCGLVNPSATCKCHKRVEYAIENKRLNPEHTYFVSKDLSDENIKKIIREMNKFDEESNIFITNPKYEYNKEKLYDIMERIKKMV